MDDKERFEQPHPGSTGHESERGEDLEEDPEAEQGREGAGGDSEQADQESKHSHPTSDPPANY